MRKRVRQALPGFLLTAAVPLIPVVAFLAGPRPPAAGCDPANCRAFALSAHSFHSLASVRFPANPPPGRPSVTARGRRALAESPGE
jgi:hypothetical protein